MGTQSGAGSPRVVTCREAGLGSDALQDVGWELLAWLWFGAQIPHIWMMCGEEGRVRSPCFPKIALVRAGNRGDTPASSLMPLEMLKYLNKVQPLCSPSLGLPWELLLEIWLTLGEEKHTEKNIPWIFKAH